MAEEPLEGLHSGLWTLKIEQQRMDGIEAKIEVVPLQLDGEGMDRALVCRSIRDFVLEGRKYQNRLGKK